MEENTTIDVEAIQDENQFEEEIFGDVDPAAAVEAVDEEVEVLSEEETVALVEALVFSSGELLSMSRIKEVTGLSESQIKDAIETIEMKFEHEESGIELVTVGNKFQFRTKGLFGPYVRKLNATRPRKLSRAALETVAIIAYRQPIVKSDIEKIRGVDASPTLKTLLEKKLIKIVGHQATVGQPALYGTTEEFLNLFGMKSLNELPSLREVKEFEHEPGEPGQDEEAESTTSHEYRTEEESATADSDTEGETPEAANS